MKTIEERIAELYDTWPRIDKAAIRRTMVALAADLNAEKEKEAAELKTAIQELSNSKVAGDQLNAKYIKQIAEQSTLPPRINAQAFWCDNRHVVDYEAASEIEKELLAELTATRARLAEVNGQCTELLDDLEQVTVAHAQAESRLAELEEALETVEIRYAAFQLHTETTIRERDKRLAELEGITERLYEQQNYHHPNTCLGYVGKFMADYEAYKEGKK